MTHRVAFQIVFSRAEYRFFKQIDKKSGDKERLKEDFHDVCEMEGVFRNCFEHVTRVVDED
jgi:hypothetical protein